MNILIPHVTEFKNTEAIAELRRKSLKPAVVGFCSAVIIQFLFLIGHSWAMLPFVFLILHATWIVFFAISKVLKIFSTPANSADLRNFTGYVLQRGDKLRASLSLEVQKLEDALKKESSEGLRRRLEANLVEAKEKFEKVDRDLASFSVASASLAKEITGVSLEELPNTDTMKELGSVTNNLLEILDRVKIYKDL